MKKLLSLFLSVAVAFALAGCSIEPIEATEPPQQYTYNDFTPAEKALLTEYLGEVIPFVPNDYYFLEGHPTADSYESGFHFHATGNTAEDFSQYRAYFAKYTLKTTYTDDKGNTWYSYIKGNLTVDIAYYTSSNVGHIEAFASVEDTTTAPTTPETPPSPSAPITPDVDYEYEDWNSNDRSLFIRYIGALIPFLPNNEYYIKGYQDEVDYENGLRFITVGTTEAEFEAYLEAYSDYTFEGPFTGEDGITWYEYYQDDVFVSITYNEFDGVGGVDVYVYSDLSQNPDEGGSGGESGKTEVDLITNDGKGLPTDSDGVYDVNFKDATYVKDVTDQGYYLGGCPTTGAPAVLIIPIGFRDGAALTADNIDKLEIAFGENGDYYFSVDNFYKISSYGQLDLDITVLDQWIVPTYESTHYAAITDSDGQVIGEQILMDEILQKLSLEMDLSAFDSDSNGTIDAVVLINNLDVGEDDFHWAYRYWNMYYDDDDYPYEYDGVSANDYIWASYFFLHENDNGYDVSYDDFSVTNTYTYIHEFGHILGADDYYDTSVIKNHPMDGYDIMDYMLGDHSAYTKFNLGWVTTSRLVVSDSSVTLTLEDFSKNGDTIIIANNWDTTLGAYQEYYIVVYYKNVGLNDGEGGYFGRDGIVVYHINASLFREEFNGELYYDVYNNNTDLSDPKGYGTEDNLIEFVKTSGNDFTYTVGDTLPATLDDNGNPLGYTFTVDAITADTATITFTKR